MKANLIKAAWVIGGVVLGAFIKGYVDGSAQAKTAASSALS